MSVLLFPAARVWQTVPVIETSTRRTVVLVEGPSDKAAVAALASRRHIDLLARRVEIAELGGVTGIARALERFGPRGEDARLAGLCDSGEERFFARALADVAGAPLDRAGMETLGFFVCVGDLEYELIRALGTDDAQRVIDGEGDGRLFATFQNQPAQRQRPVEHQLHRFVGTTSGRKEKYATAFVEALDPARAPRPLGLLLDWAVG